MTPTVNPADPRPVLYVDVDGVLNLFAALDHDGEAFLAATQHKEYLIRVPNGTRERIALLSEHFQMVWGTAWEHDAPASLSPHLGFGADWPVADGFNRLSFHEGPLPLGVKLSDELRGTDENVKTTWKLAGLLDHAATHTLPFAWLDDDLQPDAYAAFEQITVTGRPCLLAQTDPMIGLTDSHVRRLLSWAQCWARSLKDHITLAEVA